MDIKGSRHTTYHSDITLSDGRTFIATPAIVNVDLPSLTSVVEKVEFQIMLADPTMEHGALFEDGIIGALAEVRLVLVDTTNGQPETSIDNTFLFYKGYVSAPSYQIDTTELGSSTAIYTCASPMADLDLVRAFYTSKEYINQFAPDDTCFDQVYEGSGSASLRWGKK